MKTLYYTCKVCNKKVDFIVNETCINCIKKKHKEYLNRGGKNEK